MEELTDSIVESREELMISASGQGKPVLRTAHFLNPSVTKVGKSIFKPFPPTMSSLPLKVKPKKWPLSVTFRAWNKPSEQWKEWIEKMVSLHEITWERAGVHEAILNSAYTIVQDCDLIFGIAERWSPDTKSFIFPWGEATITLEDLMMSGYSVLGAPVFISLEDEELKSIKAQLMLARKEMTRSSAKKASHVLWMRKFMDSGNEVEHEAFLAYWLSRFVLSEARDTVSEFSLSIAIHLARGIRIALAPAILASLYRDLSLLKKELTCLECSKGRQSKNSNDVLVTGAVTSPFQLVQVWIWERFVELRPEPNLTKNGEPRLARWDKLTCRIGDVRFRLDSANENFLWRPYDRILPNWTTPFFDGDEEVVVSGLDEEILSFSQCLKVSELVGHGFIEQYLPHRVAMQFGFDQDIPGYVARCDICREISWSYYNRPMIDEMRYLPSWLLKGEVTIRYLDCWKRSISSFQGKCNGVQRQKKSSTTSRGKAMSWIDKSTCIERKSESVIQFNGFSLMFNVNRTSLERSKEKSEGETSAGSALKPKIGNDVKNRETFLSSLKVTSGASKQEEGAEHNTFISGISAQISKQKNGNPSVAPGNPGNQSGILSKGPKRNNKLGNLSATPNVVLKTSKESTGYFVKENHVKRAAVSHDSPLHISKETIPVWEDEKKDIEVSNEFIRIRPAQSLKRKNGENHEVASPSYPSKLTKTLVRDLAFVKEINSRLVPPGFASKLTAEASHPVEEGSITAADMLKYGDKKSDLESGQFRDDNIFSGKFQSMSSTAFKEFAETAMPLIAVEKCVVQPEALGSRQDGDGDNRYSHSGQSHSLMSKITGGKVCNNWEPFSINRKPVVSAESTKLERAVEHVNHSVDHVNHSTEEIFHMPSITENVGGSSSYLIPKPWLRLEVRIRRLEKLSSDLKAAKFGQTAQSGF